jgi:cell wall-associated NlpC family hydrolase
VSEKGFFADGENLQRLKSEIIEWENTPYKHWTGVKGRGCDCIHLIVRTFTKVGAHKGRQIIIPKYPRDWHLHNGQKLLVDGIKAQFDVDEVDPKEPKNGDIVLYKFGLHEAHGGIFMDDKYVYQALTDIGVQRRRYDEDYFYYRMKRAFRVKS